jgi:DNA repair protein RadC
MSPSPQDIALTNRIKEAMNIFEVRVMDHLILGNNSYYSMADECVL